MWSVFPSELKPAISVLRGRLAEALGHDKDALDQYKIAVESPDRAAAAEAKLLEIVLRQKRDEISQADALRELETLSVMWRGDGVEVKSAANAGADLFRYRTLRRIAGGGTDRDQAAAQFGSYAAGSGRGGGAVRATFLSPKGDDLPPVDALGMFYEYRELTPIGRRGDEMIRRLADRLVAVDLLDQASELLQYQVDRGWRARRARRSLRGSQWSI